MASNKTILKKVNIHANRHIRGTNYPVIYGLHRGLILSLQDIKTCIDAGAKVYEVVSKGKTVLLTEENYYINGKIILEEQEKEARKVVHMESSFIPEQSDEDISDEDSDIKIEEDDDEDLYEDNTDKL